MLKNFIPIVLYKYYSFIEFLNLGYEYLKLYELLTTKKLVDFHNLDNIC